MVSLVALIVTPLIFLFALVAIEYAAAKRQLLAEQGVNIANRVNSAIDREIAGVLGMLVGLAGIAPVSNDRIEEFNRMASLRKPAPQVLRVWSFDDNGEALPSANPARREQSLDQDVLKRVLNGETAVSEVRGEGLKQAYVVLAIPTNNNGARGIAAAMSVAPLSEQFALEGMDRNWAAAVIDRNGNFVARSLDAESRIGQPARPELIQTGRSKASSGTFENVTYEGLHAQNYFRRSKLTGWTTVIAVPHQEMTAPLRRAITLLVLGAAIILAVTLSVAALLARRISEPVRSLSRYAQALAQGQKTMAHPKHIVELNEVQAALEDALAQGARLTALVASSGDAIMSIDLDGTIQTWNSGAETLFGYTRDEIVGKSKTQIVPDNKLEEFQQMRRHIMDGNSVRIETQRQHKDGTIIDVSLDSAPIRSPTGKIVAISSIIHDIRERKAAEAQAEFLMREAAHRSKNQLAIIQSIASQAARSASSKEDFVVSFERRLQGLAASHDLLTSRNWREASLGQLVQRQLEVFVPWPSSQVEASGPEVGIDAASAQSLGLALHELATNSVKYGALSSPSGRVTIDWDLSESGNERQLTMTWEETGGPPVTEPKRRGFGTHVIERMLAATLNGNAAIEYRAHGLYWRFTCPHNA